MEDDRHKVVVSFGGGSLRGLAGNLALARLLEELDLRRCVDEVWGTSAGAVVGSGWVTGTTALDVLDLVCSLAHRRSAVDFSLLRFALAILGSLPPFRRPLPDGVITGRAFLDTIERGLRVRTFEECEIPFRTIACSDDGHATRKVFRRGDLLPAVFASMALPGVVEPRPDADDNQFYDGGLVEKTPLYSPIAEHGRSGDQRTLVVIATHFAGETQRRRARGFFNRFMHAISALEDVVWEYQLREAREHRDIKLMVLSPKHETPPTFAFDRTAEQFLLMRRSFAESLDDARLATTFGIV